MVQKMNCFSYTERKSYMVQNISTNLTNEYFIMNEIVDNENITQRELSRELGISLGAVNLLINKMVSEGIIKMEQVSQKQVAYMLTPAGMVEKAKKTICYLKGHYRVIYETKEKIKMILNEFSQTYENIYVLKVDDEMGELIKLAVSEYKEKNKTKKINLINEGYDFQTIECQKTEDTVLLYVMENEIFENKKLETNAIKKVNLLDRL